MRINVYLDDLLLAKVDEFCEKNRFKRSTLISIALRDYINAHDVAPQLKQILGDFLKASGQAVTGEISADDYDAFGDDAQLRIEQLRSKLER